MTATIIPFPQRPGSDSPQLTPKLLARIEDIEITIAAFCSAMLDDTYRELCEEALADCVCLDPTTFARGRTDIWAGGIIHLVGSRSGLFHRTGFGPHLPASEIARLLGASSPSISAKSKQLRTLLELDDSPLDTRYRRRNELLDALDDLAVAFDDDPTPAQTLLEQAAVIDNLIEALDEVDPAAEPDAPRTERALRAFARDMRTMAATEPVDPRAAMQLAELAAASLVDAHVITVRANLRMIMEPARFARVPTEHASLLGELAMCALEDEVAIHEGGVDDLHLQRRLLPQLLHAIDEGRAWGLRNAVVTDADARELLAGIHAELDEIELIFAYSIGLSSPLALVMSGALEQLAEEWIARLGAGERALFERARDAALADTDPATRDLLEPWFDTGIALALALQLAQARAARSDEVTPRTLDPMRWLELLDTPLRDDVPAS